MISRQQLIRITESLLYEILTASDSHKLHTKFRK
jgi:hypothetical protein